jgi:hypothetical protein
MAKLYFAHPMSSYGSVDETKIVDTLQKQGFDVLNPGDAEHCGKSKTIFNDAVRETGNKNAAASIVMDYFMSVAAACDACVFLTFPDGSISAGVGKEVKRFLAEGKTVLEAKVDGEAVSLTPVSDLSGYVCRDVATTRRMLSELKPGYGAYRPPLKANGLS